eukprot:CAMPEP_0175086702 /NCGR_PEP_ID=MMETSP0052_2-20121109/29405_1 /TAXON_ID=51329 ORGANISM="Polytomella parva, Strain SAG 63-3" /NCGR_SAMPLE_ID=MMETSP0052_2 /ASSEMBLY_ACC=CAM_ASM_000194 /LENGTH=317 /DNA_ID=CAMNT_0016358933 /DNA_START=172 /DNA_END=1125 /DNA_ORIENTATION=+
MSVHPPSSSFLKGHLTNTVKTAEPMAALSGHPSSSNLNRVPRDLQGELKSLSSKLETVKMSHLFLDFESTSSNPGKSMEAPEHPTIENSNTSVLHQNTNVISTTSNVVAPSSSCTEPNNGNNPSVEFQNQRKPVANRHSQLSFKSGSSPPHRRRSDSRRRRKSLSMSSSGQSPSRSAPQSSKNPSAILESNKSNLEDTSIQKSALVPRAKNPVDILLKRVQGHRQLPDYLRREQDERLIRLETRLISNGHERREGVGWGAEDRLGERRGGGSDRNGGGGGVSWPDPEGGPEGEGGGGGDGVRHEQHVRPIPSAAEIA